MVLTSRAAKKMNRMLSNAVSIMAVVLLCTFFGLAQALQAGGVTAGAQRRAGFYPAPSTTLNMGNLAAAKVWR
jgi:hypothetical protein